MKTNNWIIIFPCMALAVLPIGCGRDRSAEKTAADPRLLNEVKLNKPAIEAGGIKTEPVVRRMLVLRVEAPGVVAVNQKRFAEITARTHGRIERINVFAGDRVQAGQQLLELYSPEFYSAQGEFLQMFLRGKNSERSEHGETDRRLLGSAREKLKILGMSDSEIDSLQKRKEIEWLFPVRSPFSGSVLESGAVNGAGVEAGTSLYKIADLSSLWVLVHVREGDLSSVQTGSSAEVRASAFPGMVFHGNVTALGGVLDEQSRTVQVRVEIANTAGLLKPGMYVNAVLAAPQASAVLAVPESAVRKIEGKPVVFVPSGAGSFRKREVAAGRTADGFVEIIWGLKEGETVVVDGSFALKSELLKSAMEGE